MQVFIPVYQKFLLIRSNVQSIPQYPATIVLYSDRRTSFFRLALSRITRAPFLQSSLLSIIQIFPRLFTYTQYTLFQFAAYLTKLTKSSFYFITGMLHNLADERIVYPPSNLVAEIEKCSFFRTIVIGQSSFSLFLGRYYGSLNKMSALALYLASRQQIMNQYIKSNCAYLAYRRLSTFAMAKYSRL